METVYRFEDIASGHGPFRSGLIDELGDELDYIISTRHSNGRRFPALGQDSKIYKAVNPLPDKYDYRCAFNTIKKVQDAFTHDEYKALHELGCRLYRIELIEVIRSKFQAVFKPEHIIEKVEIDYPINTK